LILAHGSDDAHARRRADRRFSNNGRNGHDTMTTQQVIFGAWDWEPSVLIGCAALLVGYWVEVRPVATRATRRATLFMTGVALLLLALISPIDVLGDRYLFSAHMFQHLLLVLAVPPVLLLGIPARAFERLVRWTPADRVERALGRPLLAWALGMGTLWVWHVPALYDLALRSQGVHILQHLCFLVSATIFWWPVIAPLPGRKRLPSLGAVAYLIAAGLASSLLGIIITLAPLGLYPAYLHPVDRLGLLPLIRGRGQGQWNFSALADQQTGGLLMWTLSSPVYLLASSIALARWYREAEQDEEIEVPLAQETPRMAATPGRVGGG